MAIPIVQPQPGDRFGRLTLVERAGKDDTGGLLWSCRCDCGSEGTYTQSNLRRGATQSCGCIRRERREERTGRPEYAIWEGMIRRCHNEKAPYYAIYGGRGIHVCDAWRNDFAAFIADVGPRPSSSHSLERVDNERGYEPGNVVWATPTEQNRNMRRNVWIEHNGTRMVAADWAKSAGLNSKTFLNRLRLGWSVERALTEPVKFGPHN